VIRGYIILGLVIVTFLVGVLNYKYYKQTNLRFFMLFMVYTFVSEVVANIFILLSTSTILIYNIYNLASTVFLLLFYRKIVKNKIIKKSSIFLIVLFSLCVVLNSIFGQHIIYMYQNNTYVLGFLFVIILIILFFVETLNSDKILSLDKLPTFWLSIGLFIFNICLIPVMVIARFIGWSGVYDYILLGLNVVMYSCFSYAFILSKKEFNT
jgi:hypothetical protein